MQTFQSTQQKDLKEIQELRSFIERAISLTASSFREKLSILEGTEAGSPLVAQYRKVSSEYFKIDRQSSSNPLDNEDQIVLKKLYRQIASKAHPDVNQNLAEGPKKELEEVFKEAKSAFDNQDLEKLQLLLVLVSDGPNDLKQTGIALEDPIKKIREKANQVFLEAAYIGGMKIGEFYLFIQDSIKRMEDFIKTNKQSSLKGASMLELKN